MKEIIKHEFPFLLFFLLLVSCFASARGERRTVAPNPKDNLIVLSSAKSSEESQQEKTPVTVNGTVTDSKGEPLIGVSILIRGTSIGTVTDMDGNFKLQASKGDVLEISYLGYATQTVTVTDDEAMKITLAEDTQALDEVVVTALGIKRATKALSYNVQEVKGDEITAVKDANFMNSLAGKVAGVQINSAANGAGGPARVVMRGVKSLTGSNNALYVIDGIPMYNASSGANTSAGVAELNSTGQPTSEGIADINPEDIESISVLNGPAAAALYGSSAANGVVLITTKKGSEGAMKVTYTHNTTFNSPLMMPEFQNTYGNVRGSFASWGAKGTALPYDPADFFRTGTNISNAITVSIGNQHNQTYFSAATNNSDAIIPNSDYNRYNFTFRNTSKFLKDKMTLDVGASYIIQNQTNPVAAGGFANPIAVVYMWPRGEDFNEVRAYEEWDASRNIYVQRWTWGADAVGTTYAENPYWEMYRKLRETDKSRYMFNASLSYQILDWLNISGRIRVDNSVTKSERMVYATSVSTDITDPNNTGFYAYSSAQDKTLYGDAILNINKSFDDLISVSANIGSSLNHQSYEMNSYSGPLGFIPNVFMFSNLYKDMSGPGYDSWRQREYAIFANLELGFKNAVYLTMTARNEWSSTLSNTSQLSYFFPSVGVSAILSELLPMPEQIDYLKVRGSFADVGSPLPRNLTETYYTWDGATANVPSYRPLTKLYPEKTDSWEVGLTAKLLKHINIDLTWYLSNTKKQTIPISLSAASGGYSYMYMQTGNVRNKGIELSVGYENQWRDFGFSTNFTYSMNRNRITKLFDSYYDPVTDKTYYPSDVSINSGNNPIEVGGTMGDIYAARDLRRDNEGNIYIDPASGNVVLEELEEDRKLGTTLPSGNLGWTNTFTWKGLTLNTLFTARLGGLATSYTQMFMDQYGVSKTTAEARDAGGIFVNNGYIDAEAYYRVVANPKGGLTQAYTYDATTVRLQELSLGYTLPRKWFRDRMKMTVSFIGRNLWMIYCKAPFDPEVAFSTGTYNQNIDYLMTPSLRNLGFSLKVEL